MDIRLFLTAAFFAGTVLSQETSFKLLDDYMVCKPITGVFSSVAGSENGEIPVLTGPSGVRGPVGEEGEKGAKGAPDYSQVDKIVKSSLKSVNDRIYKLEKDLETFATPYLQQQGSTGVVAPPTKSPRQIADEKACKARFQSPLLMGSLCYNIVGGEGILLTHSVAQVHCEKLGGNLADLNSRDLYNKIYDYADRTYNTVVEAWTGMRYEGDTLISRDGQTLISYAKWTSGYPRKQTSSYYSSFTRVYIFIDTSSNVRRLLNSRPTTKKAYAICVYDLKGNSTTPAN